MIETVFSEIVFMTTLSNKSFFPFIQIPFDLIVFFLNIFMNLFVIFYYFYQIISYFFQSFFFFLLVFFMLPFSLFQFKFWFVFLIALNSQLLLSASCKYSCYYYSSAFHSFFVISHLIFTVPTRHTIINKQFTVTEMSHNYRAD